MKISSYKQFIIYLILKRSGMEILIINYNESEVGMASLLPFSTLINAVLIFHRTEWLPFVHLA